MKSERCVMPDMYIGRTIDVKPNCTSGDVYRENHPVHDVYMAGKPRKKPVKSTKPVFEPSKLRAYRKKKNLSQHQLSEQIGAYLKVNGLDAGHSYSMLGRMERGLEPYNQIILQAAAAVLGTDVKSLLFVDPDAPERFGRNDIHEIIDEVLSKRRQT